MLQLTKTSSYRASLRSVRKKFAFAGFSQNMTKKNHRDYAGQMHSSSTMIRGSCTKQAQASLCEARIWLLSKTKFRTCTDAISGAKRAMVNNCKVDRVSGLTASSWTVTVPLRSLPLYPFLNFPNGPVS